MLITVGCGILGGSGVVMVSLLVLMRVPLAPFWTSFCCFFFATLPSDKALLRSILVVGVWKWVSSWRDPRSGCAL